MIENISFALYILAIVGMNVALYLLFKCKECGYDLRYFDISRYVARISIGLVPIALILKSI